MSRLLLDKGGEEITLDPFGVCEVICWMLTVQDAMGLNTVFEGQWGYRLPRAMCYCASGLKRPLERPTSLDSVKTDSGTLPS
jgi:hypothetical protein